MATKYEFAIKKDILNSGKTNYTPVCREKTRFRFFRRMSNPWQRITNIYDKYVLMDLDWIPELTYRECELHIKGYQAYLKEIVDNEVATVEFHTLEEKEI